MRLAVVREEAVLVDCCLGVSVGESINQNAKLAGHARARTYDLFSRAILFRCRRVLHGSGVHQGAIVVVYEPVLTAWDVGSLSKAR